LVNYKCESKSITIFRKGIFRWLPLEPMMMWKSIMKLREKERQFYLQMVGRAALSSSRKM
jgi:hypothetical protein